MRRRALSWRADSGAGCTGRRRRDGGSEQPRALNGTLRAADRARGIGIWAGLETLGTTVGPYAGGWLVDHASWRWVFVINVPLILAGLLVLRRVPETNFARRPLSPDVLGGALAVVGLGGVIYALTAGPASGWLSARVLIAAAAGAVSLIALLQVERGLRAPMLRLSLFASRQFDAINVITVLLYGALGTASYILFLQFELRLGYSAAQAGAALIPESAIFLLISPLSGVLVSRVGPRWLMVSGILMVAASFIWLSGARWLELRPSDSASNRPVGARYRLDGDSTDGGRAGGGP